MSGLDETVDLRLFEIELKWVKTLGILGMKQFFYMWRTCIYATKEECYDLNVFPQSLWIDISTPGQTSLKSRWWLRGDCRPLGKALMMFSQESLSYCGNWLLRKWSVVLLCLSLFPVCVCFSYALSCRSTLHYGLTQQKVLTRCGPSNLDFKFPEL